MSWKIKEKDEKWESHEYKGDYIKFSIHHHIHYEKDQWLLSCYDVFGSRQIPLKSKDIGLAKKQAIALIKMKLKDLTNDIEKAL